MSLKLNFNRRPEHELPGYKGPRVLGRWAQWQVSYWLKFPKRKPHQGVRECARRVRQMAR